MKKLQLQRPPMQSVLEHDNTERDNGRKPSSLLERAASSQGKRKLNCNEM